MIPSRSSPLRLWTLPMVALLATAVPCPAQESDGDTAQLLDGGAEVLERLDLTTHPVAVWLGRPAGAKGPHEPLLLGRPSRGLELVRVARIRRRWCGGTFTPTGSTVILEAVVRDLTTGVLTGLRKEKIEGKAESGPAGFGEVLTPVIQDPVGPSGFAAAGALLVRRGLEDHLVTVDSEPAEPSSTGWRLESLEGGFGCSLEIRQSATGQRPRAADRCMGQVRAVIVGPGGTRVGFEQDEDRWLVRGRGQVNALARPLVAVVSGDRPRAVVRWRQIPRVIRVGEWIRDEQLIDPRRESQVDSLPQGTLPAVRHQVTWRNRFSGARSTHEVRDLVRDGRLDTRVDMAGEQWPVSLGESEPTLEEF